MIGVEAVKSAGRRIFPSFDQNWFFPTIAGYGRNVLNGAQALDRMVSNFDQKITHFEEIRRLRGQGQVMAGDIYQQAVVMFIPPIDRGSIVPIVARYGDILDEVYKAGGLMRRVNVPGPTTDMPKFTQSVVSSIVEVNEAVVWLGKVSNPQTMVFAADRIDVHCTKVRHLRDQSRDLVAESSDLSAEEDLPTTVRYRAIYESIARVNEKCVEAANDILARVQKEI